MKQEIDQLNEYFQGSETVIVEAAHIYADKQPGDEQRIGAQIAAQISASLNARVRNALLIDNLNVAQSILDKDEYLTQLSSWGFVPDSVFMEKDMVPGVIGTGGLVDQINEQKTAKIKNGEGLTKRFWTPEGMVLLVKPNGIPTCAALDASFYKQKSSLAQACLTILPDGYQDQQKTTQTIMQKAGILIPVANLYFDQKGGRALVLN